MITIQTQYRYVLDASSKKFQCPQCGRMDFVRYLDTYCNEYLDGDYGKCDRATKCGFQLRPNMGKIGCLVDFILVKDISQRAVAIVLNNSSEIIVPKSQILEMNDASCYISKWFIDKEQIPITFAMEKDFSNDASVSNYIVKKNVATVKPSFISLELLDKINDNHGLDNLTKLLLRKFTNKEVRKVISDYVVCCDNTKWDNSTVFWQIDQNENIHAGKIMLYDSNGKRIKEPYNHLSWVHSAYKIDGFNLKQCLFGLHLTRNDYSKTIALVESEKTALVMSIVMPEFIWLATGGKGNLKQHILEPIKNRNIIVYPDNGEYKHWLEKVKILNKIGFRISISSYLESKAYCLGTDLADIILK